MYIYQNSDWPKFMWDSNYLLKLLSDVRNKQGEIIGKIKTLGFDAKNYTNLEMLTLDIIKSNEIEGENLNTNEVRSSIARRLGLDIQGLVESDRNVDGVVDLMLDATKNYDKELDKSRLLRWHNSLFPSGYSGLYKIKAGQWRDDAKGPMQVVSGHPEREKIHFEAPSATHIDYEIDRFLKWYNETNNIDYLLKAAVAHLWFITIHPFEDGNGRIARAITDMLLAKSDQQSERFYSMSYQIREQRNEFYDMLEATQKGNLDITDWIEWFLNCLLKSIIHSENIINKVLKKHLFWFYNSYKIRNERQRKIINLMLDNFEGKLNTSKWAKITKCSKDTALRDIQDLLDKNILLKSKAGGRSTSYEINNDITQ